MTTNTNTTITPLTTTNFEAEVLQDATPILIDFWAPWCGPCRAMAPELEKAAAVLEGKVRVAKVNVDDQPELAQSFGIRGIPTLVLMKGGKVVDASSGAVSADVLVTKVRAQLAAAALAKEVD